jgi:hypothetical protein
LKLLSLSFAKSKRRGAENGEGFAEKIWKAIIWVMNLEHRVEENKKAASSLASHPGRVTRPRGANSIAGNLLLE